MRLQLGPVGNSQVQILFSSGLVWISVESLRLQIQSGTGTASG